VGNRSNSQGGAAVTGYTAIHHTSYIILHTLLSISVTMSAIDQSQMPRAQPGRDPLPPPPVVGKKGYPFWLGGTFSIFIISYACCVSPVAQVFAIAGRCVQEREDYEEKNKRRKKRDENRS
jgi:hypothetical protein